MDNNVAPPTPIMTPTMPTMQASFVSDLARIEDWFRSLPYSDALYAVQSIISALPYSIPLQALSRPVDRTRTPLSSFTATESPHPTRFVAFDVDVDQSPHTFHAPTATSPICRSLSRSAFGVIGQERPLMSPEIYDDEHSFYPHPHQQQSQSHAVGRQWLFENQQSRLSPAMSENLTGSSPRRHFSVPQTGLTANPPPFPSGRQKSHTFSNAQLPNLRTGHHHQHQHHGFGAAKSTNMKHEIKGKIPDDVDMSLVEDVPAWLRSLRLHKYTHLFWPDPSHPESTSRRWTYREMIELTDEDLERMGVGALGARRKMLRMFELVKHHLGLPVTTPPSPAGESSDEGHASSH
jgi:hypothetical protein